VNADSLRKQLTLAGQSDFLRFPYHQAIINNLIPLSIGGGIGQARTLMQILRKAHLGEVTVTGRLLQQRTRHRAPLPDGPVIGPVGHHGPPGPPA